MSDGGNVMVRSSARSPSTQDGTRIMRCRRRSGRRRFCGRREALAEGGAASVLGSLFSSSILPFPGERGYGGFTEQGRHLAGADFQPRRTARSTTRDSAKVARLVRGRTRFILRRQPNPVGRNLHAGASRPAILISGH